MNIFLQQAAQFMGVRLGDRLSKTDFKRLRAKAKKMQISEKKASRKQNTINL
jgi:hypothetical protein